MPCQDQADMTVHAETLHLPAEVATIYNNSTDDLDTPSLMASHSNDMISIHLCYYEPKTVMGKFIIPTMVDIT